ncbi:uncharacterized protein LOC128999134 [Macrosteles quadrilineatus]|uniref:uncharacterized protein LOC128999134 n=1 Tax=Macrosteles quadrilineatus TaxID=74068 RepID=UPI0023E32CE4|nr:uncharacterized protein LOC128999134 [Macrosteles quadrilineatus]
MRGAAEFGYAQLLCTVQSYTAAVRLGIPTRESRYIYLRGSGLSSTIPSYRLVGHIQTYFTANQYRKMFSIVIVLATAATAAFGQGTCPPSYPHCRLQMQNWHLGLDSVRPSGTIVHGHANTPVSQAGLQGSAHGSHVFGGPYNGASTVGGGVNYQHPSGLQGGLDVTHSRGQGNVVTGSVGGSTKLGPGTLSIHGAANTIPHSSKVQGSVGATYSVPLP